MNAGRTREAVEAFRRRPAGRKGEYDDLLLDGALLAAAQLDREGAEPAARLAVDYFVYQATKEVGALAAVLGGIDGLVFTAGIGENSAEIRKRICQGCSWLGVELDDEANEGKGPRISRPGSRVSAWVIPTNEELIIARQAGALLGLTEARA